ncbi:MAG: L-histidine N(alpha)-methyltransferase [Bacteroidales bacterium]|nr:L-histidine N(alpha)-methyltransferase [Bacteroidales bacterium]
MMNFVNEDIITLKRISITNLLQEIGSEEVRTEIIAGLNSDPKYISSKYFYNNEGSALFEEITRLDEYYPTRTEIGILKRIAPGLMKTCAGYDIIELGSGDSSKISILLGAAAKMEESAIHYLPLDISQEAIRSSAEELVSVYPNLYVEGYAVDFTSQFGPIKRERPAMICFFGSTIGNFEWEDSLELLQNISRQMKKEDLLLLGMDMVKPQPVLHAAYNDDRGVTAAFNKNILNTVNELIRSDFQPDDFDHLAFYNESSSRIEMHLVANRDLTVHSPHFNEDLLLKKGESIHTENSHKYSTGHIREIVEATGLQLNHTHTDNMGWFAVTEFKKT